MSYARVGPGGLLSWEYLFRTRFAPPTYTLAEHLAWLEMCDSCSETYISSAETFVYDVLRRTHMYNDVHTVFIDVRTVLGDVLPEKYCSHKASVARNCPSASYSNSGPRGGIVIYTARARMLRQQTEDYLDLNILCFNVVYVLS